ncbi:hypothetical protein EPO34_01415 [Patescibacteria group bacterium]|nr:MAG: hypothetical protein EPO34_01415 [Patescibacteria group bacterium]
MKSALKAIKTSIDSPRAGLEAAAAALAVFALLILVPVYTTPGNDILFQLHITPWEVIVLMGLLSVLNGLLFVMYRHAKRNEKRRPSTKEATTLLGIAGASVLSTLACAACYSSVLAVFGVGGTAFIVTNRWWFSAAAIGITLFAMHATAKKVNGTCETACNT